MAERRQRLIFLNRYYWPDESATSLMLTDISRALADRGCQVIVLTGRQLLENPTAQLPRAEHLGPVEIFRVRSTHFGRAGLLGRAADYLCFSLSALYFLLLNLRQGDVVIAKTDPPLISVVATLAVLLKRGRLVNWLQDVYPEIAVHLGVLSKQALWTSLMVALRDWSLRRAAANIAIGTNMGEFIAQRALNGPPLKVIHNWSPSLNSTFAPEKSNPYRRKFGFAGKIVFSYSGNLGRAHVFDALIAAAKQINHVQNIEFLIIGGGARWHAVQDQVRNSGMTNWHFLPYQSRKDLADSLGAADVHLISLDQNLEDFVVPSKLYGVLAAGRPCIFVGSPQGEIARILNNFRCGTSVSPNEVAALARIMLELADSRERRLQMGANARAAFINEYTLGRALRQWLDLLNQLGVATQ